MSLPSLRRFAARISLSTLAAVAACDAPQLTRTDDAVPPTASVQDRPVAVQKGLPGPVGRLTGERPVPVPAGERPAGSRTGTAPMAVGGTAPAAERSAPPGTIAAQRSMGAMGATGAVTHLLWQNMSTGKRGFWPMSGTTYTGGWADVGEIPTAWNIAAIADFTADNKPDLVWENLTTGRRGVWPMDGATYTGGFVDIGEVPSPWVISAAADFAPNGWPDILWTNPVSGVRGIWTMASHYEVSGWVEFGAIPAEWDVAAVADMTGDGKPDIIWQNTSTGTRGIWPMDGTTYTGGWHSLGEVPTEWRIAAAGDFTGDGKADLVWQNMTTGKRGIWPMNGASYPGGWHDLGEVPAPWSIDALLLAPPTGGSDPTIAGVSPALVTPGASVTITGANFGSTTAGVTLSFDGVAATVTSVTPTSITATLPSAAAFACKATALRPVALTVPAGSTGASAMLQVATPLSMEQGESLVFTGTVGCRELPAAAGRYVVALYNSSTTVSSQVNFELHGSSGLSASGHAGASAMAAPQLVRYPQPRARSAAPSPSDRADDRHLDLMEKNRAAFETLRGVAVPRRGTRPAASMMAAVPAVGNIVQYKVPNVNGNLCGTTLGTVVGRVVYVGTRSIIVEDTSSAANALRGSMDATYQQIGTEFDNQMYPVVRDNFGDPLVRDASNDANQRVVMVFTPLINSQAPGLAGFVTSCDFFPTSAGNVAGNQAEIFYARVPDATGTAASWRRTMRSTVVHEVKHIASFGARVANGTSSWEESWLEEGTARHAEELWLRAWIYNAPFRANLGYGDPINPASLYCDVRFGGGWPECDDAPYGMFRHFQTLHDYLTQPGVYTPFGRVDGSDWTFYASAWSLVRYAIDRYGLSDAAFLTAINSSTTSGVTNLAARAGVGMDELVGRWMLAVSIDDDPSLTGLQTQQLGFATWNFRNIFAGMNADFPSSYQATPAAPVLAAGDFMMAFPPARAGNGFRVQLNTTVAGTQAIALTGSGGAATPATAKMAIVRVE